MKEETEQIIIEFVEWLTHEDSPYSVMYGNQLDRFADNEREYTIKELLKIYKER